MDDISQLWHLLKLFLSDEKAPSSQNCHQFLKNLLTQGSNPKKIIFKLCAYYQNKEGSKLNFIFISNKTEP